MEPIEAGMFAYSKCGHDRGELFLVCRVEGEYLHLVNGKNRTLEKPKKKKMKHIQIVWRKPEGWCGDCLKNEDIRRFIKDYKREN